jgi:release factor glutamine methyltransferase
VSRIVALPGVYRPRSDTNLLIRALLEAAHPLLDRTVLDLCAGTGALGLAAARQGAEVTAVDVSRRAVANVRLNARLNGVRVEAVRGDLWNAVHGRRFDVIVTNPPYLPAPEAPRGAARAWDAGYDGRDLLDPICRRAADHLRPGGKLLVIQSSLADAGRSEDQLAEAGLIPRVVARYDGRLGPLAAARADWMRSEGRLGSRDVETLVVIEGACQPLRGSRLSATTADRPTFSTTR